MNIPDILQNVSSKDLDACRVVTGSLKLQRETLRRAIAQKSEAVIEMAKAIESTYRKLDRQRAEMAKIENIIAARERFGNE